jgi:hypothetical protein
MEVVRDAEEIVASNEFDHMHMPAGELLDYPPHELSGEQFKDIRRAVRRQARAIRYRFARGRVGSSCGAEGLPPPCLGL